LIIGIDYDCLTIEDNVTSCYQSVNKIGLASRYADLGGKKFESIHLIDRIDSIDELNRFKLRHPKKGIVKHVASASNDNVNVNVN